MQKKQRWTEPTCGSRLLEQIVLHWDLDEKKKKKKKAWRTKAFVLNLQLLGIFSISFHLPKN